MDPLSFLSRVLDVSARIGAALALVALVCFVGRSSGWAFFTELDPTVYQAVIIAGLFGVALLLIDLLLLFVRSIRHGFSRFINRRKRKRAAKKNMESVSSSNALVLRYLKNKNIRRFRAPSSHALLTDMSQSGLIVRDDPSWTMYAQFTYYKVPGYIWRLIKRHTSTSGIPQYLPFINPE